MDPDGGTTASTPLSHLQPADWAALRVFLEVATQGSLSGAAAALHLSQPTVTRQLQHLERRLDLTLAIRSTRALRLTDAGQQLQATLLLVDDLLPVRRRPAVPAGSRRLGLFAVDHSELVEILAADAGSGWTVRSIPIGSAQEELAAGRLGLFAGLLAPVRRLGHRPEVRVRSLVTVPLWLALSASSPLVDQPLRLTDLADQRWVEHTDEDLAATFRIACRQAGIRPRVMLATNDMRELVTAVTEAGAVTPALPWGRRQDGLVIRPCQGLGTVSLAVLWRGDAGLDGEASLLARAARRWVRRRAAQNPLFERHLAEHPECWTGHPAPVRAGVSEPG